MLVNTTRAPSRGLQSGNSSVPCRYLSSYLSATSSVVGTATCLYGHGKVTSAFGTTILRIGRIQLQLHVLFICGGMLVSDKGKESGGGRFGRSCVRRDNGST